MVKSRRAASSRSLREDAARRDFTINAMAYAPGEGLQDFFGGQADLSAGVIRAVGEADRRFQEDALRILRANPVCFGAGVRAGPGDGRRRPEKCAAAPKNFGRAGVCGAEQIALRPGGGKILRAYPDILGVVLPELTPTVGFAQHNLHHCYDVYTHTAVAVDHVPPEVTLRLAALFHDLGKPATFSMGEDGQGHFYGHPKVSAALAEQILLRLRAPKRLREEVVRLVEVHDWPLSSEPRLIRRRLQQLGEEGFPAPGPPEGGRCGLFFVRLHKGRRSKCGGNGGKGHLSRQTLLVRGRPGREREGRHGPGLLRPRGWGRFAAAAGAGDHGRNSQRKNRSFAVT